MAVGLALGGHPTRQSADLQELVGDVISRPPELGDRLYRGYRNPNAQKLHTDSNRPGLFGQSKCDVLAMLCVRASTSGGSSRLLNAAALHQALATERPEIYARLRAASWPWVAEREWLPEWGPREELEQGLPLLLGASAAAVEQKLEEKKPVVAYGVQYGKILRLNVEAGLKMRADCPEALAEALEAMDVLEATANREGLALHLRLEEGDLLLLNNFAWMHGREAFPEEEPDGQRRHMMRLWLQMTTP